MSCNHPCIHPNSLTTAAIERLTYLRTTVRTRLSHTLANISRVYCTYSFLLGFTGANLKYFILRTLNSTVTSALQFFPINFLLLKNSLMPFVVFLLFVKSKVYQSYSHVHILESILFL